MGRKRKEIIKEEQEVKELEEKKEKIYKTFKRIKFITLNTLNLDENKKINFSRIKIKTLHDMEVQK